MVPHVGDPDQRELALRRVGSEMRARCVPEYRDPPVALRHRSGHDRVVRKCAGVAAPRRAIRFLAADRVLVEYPELVVVGHEGGEPFDVTVVDALDEAVDDVHSLRNVASRRMTDGLVTEYAWQGPKRGFDRAVVLAHGAGSDMNGATLLTVADALADAGIPSLRFNYPYRSSGKKSPDRPKVLDESTREAASELARRSKLASDRLVLGGRSMGGRYCSLVVAAPDDPVPALGLLLLGYPLHAPGRPEQPRSEHFPRLCVPVLFASGTRDALAAQPDLTKAARAIKGTVTFHWIDGADHGYRPLKSSGRTTSDVAADVAAVATDWVRRLPPS